MLRSRRTSWCRWTVAASSSRTSRTTPRRRRFAKCSCLDRWVGHEQALRQDPRGANSLLERHGKAEGPVLRGVSGQPERKTGRRTEWRSGDGRPQAADRCRIREAEGLVPHAGWQLMEERPQELWESWDSQKWRVGTT